MGLVRKLKRKKKVQTIKETICCGEKMWRKPSYYGKFTFGKDLLQVLKDIFKKFAFNKLSFEVVVGNPVESFYDKIVSQHGGRIVGTHKQDTRLMDGKLYDIKHYEILKENYFGAKTG